MTAGLESLAGRRALVVGGTGFIGTRLVERLVLEARANVRVLVRDYMRAAPLARFPIEVVRGDVLDEESLARAASGCDVVFHLATGRAWLRRERKQVDVAGTENVIRAATRAGAARVVCTSSVMAYGLTPDGDLDERAPRRKSGDLYADSKREAETAALALAGKGAPVTVLQPTVVYGPWSGIYGTGMILGMREARFPLVDGGLGLCNAVYIDDVVTALQLAAFRPEATGEAFLISGVDPVTWKEFHAYFERMLGGKRTVDVPLAEALKLHRRLGRPPSLVGQARAYVSDPERRQSFYETREGAAVMSAAQLVLPPSWFHDRERRALAAHYRTRLRGPVAEEDPIASLRPFTVRYVAAKTRVRIDKARRLLGYEPAFDLEHGMRLTEAWARWAGLFDPEPSL